MITEPSDRGMAGSVVMICAQDNMGMNKKRRKMDNRGENFIENKIS
jgi:hypothetical protein